MTRRVLHAAALGAALPAAAALGAALPAAAAAGAAAAPTEISAAGTLAYAPGEVLVRYEPGTAKGERGEIRDGLDADLQQRLLLPRTELLELPPGLSVGPALRELRSEPDVAFAEPNYVYSVATVPDDPGFNQQWPLDNPDDSMFGSADADIDAPAAWNIETGSDSVVVGVVDTGVTLAHEDLDERIWANPGESGGLESNGIDDDGNLLVDDHRGWDFAADDSDPTDEEGHGTHVAGTIGAEGDNGTGISGVAWDVSLLPLRACNALGACFNSDVAQAFAYAGEEGADVVNASISGTLPSQAQQDAIASAPDTLFVVAAGNDAGNNSLAPRYPCNYPADNLVCVAASDDRDELASFSNFGAAPVDLAAPGGGSGGAAVLSTYMADRMSESFGEPPLSGDWTTGGTPDSWDFVNEESSLAGGELTDSPGSPYTEDADNFASFGPVDLSADSRCNLRYDIALDLPDDGDRLLVQASRDGVTYSNVQTWTGVGSARLTPSISSFTGSAELYVRLRLQADGDSEVGDGVHVDNLRVRCASSGYALLQGTSMAAPHVSGAAALLRAHAPGSSVAELRNWLLDGVDPKPVLEGLVGTGGRLNLYRSLQGADGEDIRRPETLIVSGPALASRSTTAGFSFEASEPAGFQCSHNSGPFAPCPSTYTLSGLAVGSHDLQVRAVDLAGNEDATPASYAFTVRSPKRGLSACAKAKRKLKRARADGPGRKLRKLRKLVKRRCRKAR